MPTSSSRVQSNRQDASKPAGPTSVEGSVVSRRSGLLHGLNGLGMALPNEELAEVERRVSAFREELRPSGEVGQVLVRRAAFLSVRLDRCVSEETGRLAGRIRQAEADFVAPDGVDAETVAQLRAEAKARAMCDPSPEAALARKHEVAAERGFFRALKELRQVEADARAANPLQAAANFEETLASFLKIDKLGEELEARYLDPRERTPNWLPGGLDPARFSDVERPVDVPLTIGRRR